VGSRLSGGWLFACALLVMGVVLTGPAHAAPAASSATVSKPLVSMIKALRVAAPSHVSSYDRTKDFGDWTSHSTQYGYCNTRALVLIAESKVTTTRNSYCTVSAGKWFSWYNDRYYYNAYGGRTVQIDHLVPVENAWQSGAWGWTKATRVRYYNDLADPRALNAVDAHDNEAKGDSAPSRWMPTYHRCRYVRSWAAIKTRWSLSVTKAERAALLADAAGCPNTTIRVTVAPITYR
jgi:hypothetical protein